MDDKAPVTVAVGEKITPPGPTSPADTAPVRENLYAIDKGTSNFPAHTVYLEPTVQTTPPLVGPTTVTTPDSDNAQINTGWAAMNQVLQEDAAPEKAAALVKEFNEATKGERVQDAVDTFVGYVRAIETCGLSAEEKVALHRAVFDTYQPTAEEGAAAKAATQSEIDKKDPTPTEILMAQESFAPNEGTPIDLREPVTGI